MKVRNLDIYPSIEDYDRLVEEYEYIGFRVIRGKGKITVCAYPEPKPDKHKKTKHGHHRKRDNDR